MSLLEAARRGDSLGVAQALDTGVEDVNATDSQGYNALHHMARYGTADDIRRLLEAGVSKNQATHHGDSALSLATAGENMETFTALIEAGAAWIPQVGGGDDDGEEEEEESESGDSDDDDMCFGCTPLHVAAMHGLTAFAVLAIEAGCPMNAGEYDELDGATAMHLTASRGHASIVQALIEAGANVHVTDGEGATPLAVAAAAGHAGIVDMLTAAGAESSEA